MKIDNETKLHIHDAANRILTMASKELDDANVMAYRMNQIKNLAFGIVEMSK